MPFIGKENIFCHHQKNTFGEEIIRCQMYLLSGISVPFNRTDWAIVGSLMFIPLLSFQGADASIMISSPNGDAEKDAPDNISLAGDGFDTVIKAKVAVEAVCPGVVSCADILAIAARDVVVLVNICALVPEHFI